MHVEDEEPTGEEQVANSPRERRLELAVTILLGAAALLSAWGAYQSSRYSGRENSSHASATRLQVDATRLYIDAGQLTQIDMSAFFEWVDATSSGDTARAAFLRGTFRDEMTPAFDAWLDMDPLDNPDAPGTPFELPDYQVTKETEAGELEARAEAAAIRADSMGATGERYLVAVVLYAVSLFQLGIQSRVGVFELRRALVIAAAAIIGGATVWMLTLPGG